jgi:hypothetical protein
LAIQDWIPPVLSNLFRVEKWGTSYFYKYTQTGDTWKDIKYLESFNCIPELNAVINMRANAFSNGKFKVVDENGKEYPNDPILKLLKNPNWFQAEKEFLKQSRLFHDIFGNEYIYGSFGIGSDWSNAKALFTLPPNLVSAEYKEKKPFFYFDTPPEGVKYILRNPNEQEKELPNESIIHLNDNRISIINASNKNILKGQSKMEALKAPINNIRLAYESRGIILKYRGANGAWVNKAKTGDGAMLPMLPKEKEELQSTFNNYGTLEGQHQNIITNQDLAWIQSGTNNPMNLGLYQETEEDFKKIQDIYGTPPELFARTSGSTFENQKQARKGLYSDTIIPESNEWCAALSKEFYPDGKKTIVLDYMHLAIFQEDMKSRADVVSVMVNALSKALQDGAIDLITYQQELTKCGISKT